MSARFLLTLFWLGWGSVLGQPQTYFFPLEQGFNSSDASQQLTPLATPFGQTGQFMTMALAPNSCTVGSLLGYKFPAMAGLAFDDTANFLTQAWTVSFLYQVDFMDVVQTPYIRIFSMRHQDDWGFFIDPSPFWGTRMYYYHGPGFFDFGHLGATGTMLPQVVYRLTYTRAANGLVSFYRNGQLLGSFQDPANKYLPTAPDRRIVFFQDNATGPYAWEAEAGWVKDLYLSNYAWTPAEVSQQAPFCPTVLKPRDLPLTAAAFPVENSGKLSWTLPDDLHHPAHATLHHASGRAEAPQLLAQWQGDIPESYEFPFSHSGSHRFQLAVMDSEGKQWKSAWVEVDAGQVDMEVFPNPFSSQLQVRGGPGTGPFQFTLTDMLGRPCKQGQGESGQPLDLASLPVGTYLLTLRQAGKVIKRERVQKR